MAGYDLGSTRARRAPRPHRRSRARPPASRARPLASRARPLARIGVGLAVLAAPLAAQSAVGDVESASKISATVGGFAGPLADGDGFGRAVASLGDLDGDGVGDLAVGAPGSDVGGADTGAVWILFLDAGGQVARAHALGAGQGGFTGQLDAGDHFGTCLATLGDLDGDGSLELAVGAPGDDDGGNPIIFPDPSTGAVWVLSLRRDGQVVGSSKLSNGHGGLEDEQINELDHFGQSVARLPDLDGNGVDELLVGAPGDDQSGIAAGATWILFLDGTGGATFLRSIPLGGLNTRAGESLATLGDLDGNGADDFAVGGLHFNGALGVFEGYVLIVFLAPGGLGESVLELDLPPDVGDGIGNGLATLGDLDGDGVVDLAIGGPLGDDGGPDRGQVWIAFLRLDGSVKAFAKISATSGAFAGPLEDGDRFGAAVATLGDVDGDGTVDLAAGADGDDDGGAERGALWLLRLDDARWQDLGSGLGGAAGVPQLVGEGALVAGERAALHVSGASAGAPVIVVAGATRVDAPLLGGVLVPAPDVLVLPGTPTDGTGELLLEQRWPAGIPPGTPTYYQVWIVDAGGPAGFSATNALSATPP